MIPLLSGSNSLKAFIITGSSSVPVLYIIYFFLIKNIFKLISLPSQNKITRNKMERRCFCLKKDLAVVGAKIKT